LGIMVNFGTGSKLILNRKDIFINLLEGLKTGLEHSRIRKNIKIGARVKIIEKQNQKIGKLTEGIVKEILTHSSEHPYGIKIMLESGAIGRVKEIVDPHS